MVHRYLKTAESDCATDQQKDGLRSKVKSASCYLKDTLFRQ